MRPDLDVFNDAPLWRRIEAARQQPAGDQTLDDLVSEIYGRHGHGLEARYAVALVRGSFGRTEESLNELRAMLPEAQGGFGEAVENDIRVLTGLPAPPSPAIAAFISDLESFQDSLAQGATLVLQSGFPEMCASVLQTYIDIETLRRRSYHGGQLALRHNFVPTLNRAIPTLEANYLPPLTEIQTAGMRALLDLSLSDGLMAQEEHDQLGALLSRISAARGGT